ncbi:MAG TPA: hypothetical protein VGS06_17355 [Streptosporangiaceae bacterium]|nr:hypothetical protein [Streptosporangiaceae bacterium]
MAPIEISSINEFHDPEIIAEDLAYAETCGNYHCPRFPRKPELPRKWDQWGCCAA